MSLGTWEFKALNCGRQAVRK